MKRPRITLLRAAGLLSLAAVVAALSIAWRDTYATPAVRHARVALAGLPPGAPPVRVVALSDIHVVGPEMPTERLGRIVAQINALRPDLVLIAGDLVSDRRFATRYYSTRASVAPLGRLRARLGTFAVLGNHDHWRDAAEVTRELRRQGVTVLVNQAMRVGPLTLGGVDDEYTHHAALAQTLAAMDRLGGARLLLSHTPDVFPPVPVGSLLTVAGHTHCGQIRYPWGGTPATMSKYGDRYACGLVRENGKTLVTTAGLGSSVLPFRFLVPPEIWLIELTGISQPPGA